MSEHPHPHQEIITDIPAHPQDGGKSEIPHQNTFYVEEAPQEGGTVVMSAGWKEVDMTKTPDEKGRYWTTLENPDSGAVTKVPTAELYALQGRVGNRVAPREPLPYSPEQSVRYEVIPQPVAGFAGAAGHVAVEVANGFRSPEGQELDFFAAMWHRNEKDRTPAEQRAMVEQAAVRSNPENPLVVARRRADAEHNAANYYASKKENPNYR